MAFPKTTFPRQFGIPFPPLTVLSGGWQNVTVPDAAFSSFPPFTVQQNGSNFRVAPSWTIDGAAPTGKAYYVSNSGSDSNDGLTAGAPLLNLYTAIAKSDVDIIYIAAGSYGRSGFENVSPTRDISIIATGGRAHVGYYADNLSWALESAPNDHVYHATRSGIVKFWDAANLDGSGDYTELPLKASIAEVEAQAGSWYISGSDLYVRLADDRAPDKSIRPTFNTGYCGYVTGARTIYCENIDFECAGVYGFYFLAADSTHAPTGYFNNCTFKYAINNNGFSSLGGVSYFQDCEFSKNAADGSNHHAGSTVIPKLVEINCTGRANGVPGTTNQGSTVHEAGLSVRINCEYYGNGGPNVQDVNDNTKGWMLGCNSHDSAGGAGFVNGYKLQNDSDWWLDTCVSSGNTNDIYADTGATVNIRNFSGGRNQYRGGNNTGVLMSELLLEMLAGEAMSKQKKR